MAQAPEEFRVFNANDSGTGSLRQAIADAMAGVASLLPPRVIRFDPSLEGQTITLQSRLEITSGVIRIEGDIDGDGDADITISGDSGDVEGAVDAGDSQFLFIGAGATAALDTLTLTNGFGRADLATPGSVIENRGTLTITGSTIAETRVEGLPLAQSDFTRSGTIYNRAATMTVIDTVITGAYARGGDGFDTDPGDNYGNYGGGSATAGIRNTGALAIRNLTVDGTAIGGAGGDGTDYPNGSPEGRSGGLAVIGIYSINGTITVAGGGSTTIRAGAAGSVAIGGNPGVGLEGGGDGAPGVAIFGSNVALDGITLDISSVTDAPVTQPDLAGNTVLVGAAGADGAVGSDLREVFFGGDGGDRFDGLGAEDLIRMGPGNDTISGQGNITLDGEADNDLLVITGAGDVTVRGDGGEGSGFYGEDTLQFDTAFGVFASLQAGRITDLPNTLALTGTIEQVENLTGSQQTDQLVGDSFANRIEGRGGNDTLFGLEGSDTILGGEGSDSIEGGSGAAQRLEGGAGDDFIRGGADGSEILRGDAGDDTLVADGGGFDRYEGGADDDLIQVLGGINVIDGGAGDDSVQVFEALSAFDFFLEDDGDLLVLPAGRAFGTVAEGNNLVRNVETFFFSDATLTLAEARAIATPVNPPVNPPVTPPLTPPVSPPTTPPAGPTQGDDDLSGTGGPDRIAALRGDDTVKGRGGADTLLGQGGEDILRGGGGDDSLKGGGGADRLFGQGANDTLKGGGAGDFLKGGGGADRIIGGGGADTIEGNKGADTLIGGGGADLFRFAPGDGADVIQRFQQGTDQVEFKRGVSGLDDLRIEQQGSDVLVTHTRGSILFQNQNAGAFGEDDFIF